MGPGEPVAHGWACRSVETTLTPAQSLDRRRGDAFFALCSQRWYLIRREPVPGGVLGKWFVPVTPSSREMMAIADIQPFAERKEAGYDWTDEVFQASLRPGLYVSGQAGQEQEQEGGGRWQGAVAGRASASTLVGS